LEGTNKCNKETTSESMRIGIPLELKEREARKFLLKSGWIIRVNMDLGIC